MRFGVLGVQGDVSEHAEAAEAAGRALGVDVDTVVVRRQGVLPDCDVVALPGGESTTISGLLRTGGVDEELREHVEAGRPVLATCAGLIVVSRGAGESVESLGLLDVDVERNAFGRQRDSFEAAVEVEGLGSPFPAVFIRAPRVTRVGDVEVLAEYRGDVVGVRGGPEGNVLGTSFHPELTNDHRIHEMVFEAAEHDSVGRRLGRAEG